MSKKNNIFGDESWNMEEIRKAEELIPFNYFRNVKNKKVLEMGCGVGWYAYLFSKNRNKVTGVEINRRRLNIAIKNMKKKKAKVKLILGDIRKMPLKNKEFDVIFCHGVIEHFPDSENGIKEGYRVLKDNGMAMYSVPAELSFFIPLKIIRQVIDRLFGTNLWEVGYEKSFTPWKFKKMLRDKGFRIIKFEITECAPGKKFPIIGKILRILDKPFYKLGLGGRFMYAVCVKEGER